MLTNYGKTFFISNGNGVVVRVSRKSDTEISSTLRPFSLAITKSILQRKVALESYRQKLKLMFELNKVTTTNVQILSEFKTSSKNHILISNGHNWVSLNLLFFVQKPRRTIFFKNKIYL